eukprot:TRINITY_DN7696_c0_g1_i1.p1 TRINITY_DN7696_c0_g1~~TRINITY_DN7696_c0_g1_i1.p1  ORF type:complete len:149 (-),score=32.44 TRINITY_DN7696_c0_g1_i1:132-578(-)
MRMSAALIEEVVDRYCKPATGHSVLAFVLDESIPSVLSKKYDVTMVSATKSPYFKLTSPLDFDVSFCVEQDYDSLEDYSDLFTLVAKHLNKEGYFIFANNNINRIEEEENEIEDELKSVFKVRPFNISGRYGYVCQLKSCVIAAKAIK